MKDIEKRLERIERAIKYLGVFNERSRDIKVILHPTEEECKHKEGIKPCYPSENHHLIRCTSCGEHFSKENWDRMSHPLSSLPLDNVSGEEANKWAELYGDKLEFNWDDTKWEHSTYWRYNTDVDFSIRIKQTIPEPIKITADNWMEYWGKEVWGYYKSSNSAFETILRGFDYDFIIDVPIASGGLSRVSEAYATNPEEWLAQEDK